MKMKKRMIFTRFSFLTSLGSTGLTLNTHVRCLTIVNKFEDYGIKSHKGFSDQSNRLRPTVLI